jgi:hypothetical protein
MSGIKEPRQGYKAAGMVFPADAAAMGVAVNAPVNNAAQLFQNVANQYTTDSLGDKINYNPYKKDFVTYQGDKMITEKDIDLNNDGIISTKERMKFKFQDDKRRSDLIAEKYEPFMAKPNTTDKFITTQYGTYENPNYISPGVDEKSSINIEKEKIGMPENLSLNTGKDNVIDKPDVTKDNTDPTPDVEKTKKERVNEILDSLGYKRAQKNALYDAMIKAGQRISRTGLGAENLVSDVIAETSQSYDKPEKLREAADLMAAQQQLKLEQIEASKTNKTQEDFDFYVQQFGGGEEGRKKALRMLTKDAQSETEAYLAAKKSTGSGLDGVKAGIEWMIRDGQIGENENKGEISKKSYDNIKEFVASDEFKRKGPGVYQLEGIVARIDADGSVDIIKSFGTISEKTSSWFGFGS